jgi:hypothetical protein
MEGGAAHICMSFHAYVSRDKLLDIKKIKFSTKPNRYRKRSKNRNNPNYVTFKR